jgi:hypothetical protein
MRYDIFKTHENTAPFTEYFEVVDSEGYVVDYCVTVEEALASIAMLEEYDEVESELEEKWYERQMEEGRN